jgi:hypothetical protein
VFGFLQPAVLGGWKGVLQRWRDRIAARFGRANPVAVRLVAAFRPLWRVALDLSFRKGGDPTLKPRRFLNLKTGRV